MESPHAWEVRIIENPHTNHAQTHALLSPSRSALSVIKLHTCPKELHFFSLINTLPRSFSLSFSVCLSVCLCVCLSLSLSLSLSFPILALCSVKKVVFILIFFECAFTHTASLGKTNENYAELNKFCWLKNESL